MCYPQLWSNKCPIPEKEVVTTKPVLITRLCCMISNLPHMVSSEIDLICLRCFTYVTKVPRGNYVRLAIWTCTVMRGKPLWLGSRKNHFYVHQKHVCSIGKVTLMVFWCPIALTPVHQGLLKEQPSVQIVFKIWTHVIATIDCLVLLSARAHKNGRLEWECVTPIEAHSLGKIIEPY